MIPAGAGADGVLIWGSSSDAHVPGFCQRLESFLFQPTNIADGSGAGGALIAACAADRADCAESKCSNHGRCSLPLELVEASPDAGCSWKLNAEHIACICDGSGDGDGDGEGEHSMGWAGADCSALFSPFSDV
jgi:hypothetical protein